MIFFLNIKPSWKCYALDDSGILGGILLSWDPVCVDFKSFQTVAGLMVEGKLKGFDSTIDILSVYGPYNHR